MIIENINNLKITLRKQETQSICIIDNNFISFLLKINVLKFVTYLIHNHVTSVCHTAHGDTLHQLLLADNYQ